MAETMETRITQESKPEAEAVMDFLGTLDQQEKKEFLAFINGAKFFRNLAAETMKTA